MSNSGSFALMVLSTLALTPNLSAKTIFFGLGFALTSVATSSASIFESEFLKIRSEKAVDEKINQIFDSHLKSDISIN